MQLRYNKIMQEHYIHINEYGHKFYFKDQEMTIFHRLDGPAIEWSDWSKEFYVDGKRLTKKQFSALTKEQLLERAEAAEAKAYLAEDALCEIALFLSCEGYNDVDLIPFDPAHYAKKIKDAIIIQQRSDRAELNKHIGQWIEPATPIKGTLLSYRI